MSDNQIETLQYWRFVFLEWILVTDTERIPLIADQPSRYNSVAKQVNKLSVENCQLKNYLTEASGI